MPNKEVIDNTQSVSGEAVTAIMKTSTDLEHVVEALHSRGFRRSDVSVLMPVTNGRQDLSFERESKAYKGAVIGSLVGGLIGAGLSWALNGAINIPGADFLSHRAPWVVVGAFTGYGALVGGGIGALIGLGIPEYVARLAEKSIKGGTMLIAVHVDDLQWKKRAIDILKFYRAKDIVAGKKI